MNDLKKQRVFWSAQNIRYKVGHDRRYPGSGGVILLRVSSAVATALKPERRYDSL